jgi:hypothetical protein
MKYKTRVPARSYDKLRKISLLVSWQERLMILMRISADYGILYKYI